MIRPSPLILALTLSVRALVACGEATIPTQPEGVGDQSPATPSLALTRNSWTAKAPLPDVPPGVEMSSGRQGLAAGVANNAAGRPILYVFGGISSDFEFRWSGIHAYNLATNTWATKGVGLSVMYTNGVGKIGGKLYISGGFDPEPGAGFDKTLILSSLYAYDPAANRLTRKADMPLPTAQGVTGVINGKLYVLAGACLAPGGLVSCRRLFRYHLATNTWRPRPWSPHFHRGGAGGVIDGKFYVAGGHDARGEPVKDLDVYDPVTNTWKTLAPMPEARSGVAGAVLGGKLYVIGGNGPSAPGDSEEFTRTVFAYDPVKNTWKTRASLITGRSDLAAARVTLDGKSHILAVGGNTTNGGPGPNELYMP